MSEPSIEARSLTVRAGEQTLVQDVDFTLTRGRVLAVVGPNGAGKSTLLRAVAGLMPFEGQLHFGGVPAPSAAHARAGMLAYVPQQSSLASPMPVRDVVALGGYSASLDRTSTREARRQRVDDALDRTGCAHLAARAFTTLSLGERRRVLVARALATGAERLLLDEPDASLDVGHVLRIEALVRSLADAGHAVLVVLHALEVARRLADDCLLLHGGRVHAYGTPASVISEAPIAETFGVELLEREGLGFRLRGEASS